MERVDHSRAYRISNQAEALALDHPIRSRLLLACAPCERSLTELAQEFGQPLPKLHYHVGRLTACGLLREVRLEPRAGRPIRYYRAVAESFLISLADVGESMGEGLNRELRRSLAEQTNLGEFWLFYHTDEAGRFRVRMIDRDGGGRAPGVFEHWKVLRLTAEQRMALAGEIAAVIARYEAGPSTGELFLVHAAFAPKLS